MSRTFVNIKMSTNPPRGSMFRTTMLGLRKQPPLPTFKSYVENNDVSSNGVGDGGRKKTDARFYDIPKEVDSDLKVNLLPGEITVRELQNVFRYVAYSDEKSGHSGTLFVTNFKVSFVTVRLDDSTECTSGRNKLLGMDDIALANVAELYQVTKGKKKRLAPGAMVIDDIKRLEIHCKDFQLHTFCFRNAAKNDVKSIINTILHHAFPSRCDLLFAFSYTGGSPSSASRSPVVDYHSEEDWHIELRRLNVVAFRICKANIDFKLSYNFPEIFVLPIPAESELKHIGKKLNCLPLWSYTHRNGCSLIRMTSDQENIERRMFQHVQAVHPRNWEPAVYDLWKDLPPLKDLQSSVEKLRELFIPSTCKDLFSSDVGWFSSVEMSLWFNHMSSILYTVGQVVKDVVDNCKSVILKEPEASDYVAVVSSLAQLIMDPNCRTRHGFERLVEREWVALGHRFAERCGLMLSKETEQSPLFLMFLDCTWQLLQQFPSSFEFSEIYLTSVWDSITLGIFRNFVHSGIHGRPGTSGRPQSMAAGFNAANMPLSVWTWDIQFDASNISIFTNPLFEARNCLTGKKIDELYYWTLPRRTSEASGGAAAAGRARGLAMTAPTLSVCSSPTVLRPTHHIPRLRVWSHCYLRWLTPVQIVGGGTPAEHLTQIAMLDEIRQLQREIGRLEATLAPSRRIQITTDRNREDSDNPPLESAAAAAAAAAAVSRHPETPPPTRVSSSYPFSPYRPANLSSFIGTSLAAPARVSYAEDMISVDELSINDSIEC